jgi:REP element-mobilizing transposase RayT
MARSPTDAPAAGHRVDLGICGIRFHETWRQGAVPPPHCGRALVGDCTTAPHLTSWRPIDNICGIKMDAAASRPTPARRRPQKQADLPFRAWGGRRAGAGRKPNGPEPRVGHEPRAPLAARFPAHVTLKLRAGLPRLRQRTEHRTLLACFHRGCDRAGFRLAHFAVLNDHLHLLVEARDRRALSRGLQGLSIRIAKALNKLWRRRGTVFADRYHDRVLKTPREVRNALRYVLASGRKHAAAGRAVAVAQAIDVFTSAPWFDGFREALTVRGLEALLRPVTDAHTWLLTIGWRRHGLLSVQETPALRACGG